MSLALGIALGIPFGGRPGYGSLGPGDLPYIYVDSDVTVDRTAGMATFTIKLAIASSDTVTAIYGTLDGTATAPDDYIATTGTLTYTPGQTSKTVDVPINVLFYITPETYFYFGLIVATNADVRPDSLIVDGFAPTVPGTPSISLVGTDELDLTWTASTDNVAVTGYSIEHYKTGDSYSVSGTSATNSFHDSGLTTNTTYTYRVRSYDAAGNYSSYSAETSHATADTQAPSDPSAFTATAGTEQAVLAWTGSTDNIGVDHYEYQQCTGTGCTPSGSWTSTALTNPYTVTGLTGGTIYRFAIRAVDAAGNHSNSVGNGVDVNVTAYTLYSDDFTGTNTTTLATHNADWTLLTAGHGMQIDGNAIRNSDTSSSTFRLDGYTPPSANYGVQIDWIYKTVASTVLPLLGVRRDTSASTHYAISDSGFGNLNLIRRVGGVNTTIGSLVFVPSAGTYSIHMQAVTNGSQVDIKVWINGTLQTAWTVIEGGDSEAAGVFSDKNTSRITATGRAFIQNATPTADSTHGCFFDNFKVVTAI